MRFLLSLAHTSRAALVAALAASIVSGLLGAALTALINRALDASRGELLPLGLTFAAACVGMLICRIWSEAKFVELSQGTLARLRQQVCRRMASAPFRELETQGGARWLAVLVEDVQRVADFFVTVPKLLVHGAIVLGCLGYLAILSWPMFLFAIGMVLAGACLHLVLVGRGHRHLSRARDEEDELYEHFRALIDGAKELNLSRARREAFLRDVLERSVDAVRKQRTRGFLVFVGAGSIGSFLFFVVIGVVVFVISPLMNVDGSVRSAYALMFLYMMHPMEVLVEAVPELSQARIALERLEELPPEPRAVAEDAEREGRGQTGEVAQERAFERLTLRQVRHRYRRDGEDEPFLLGPIDLELKRGEVVFLVGGNGGGKTTLAKLLVGLYEPEDGQLLVNGELVSSERRERYRQRFAAVFSEFHLFENLLGISSEDLDERARTLLARLELAHKVSVERGVFSTTELSRGQQKRLALLVAYLEDRPVYVFDEWAADQDPIFKDVFYTELLPDLKARGKAVLVITHDDHYFHLADRQLKLDSGRIEERGARPAAAAI
ncbi:cyclic peptide export ABC transporter [Sorangium sp. So ce542]|uniref:cyclic peptide export ABC transporter n=1 Tax=Sorangium sp. So ce542 TaxID=3133316 RepID=UPI003F5DA947